MSEHAFISPSDLDSIALCAGKPHAEKGLPQPPSSENAIMGTRRHELMRWRLTPGNRGLPWPKTITVEPDYSPDEQVVTPEDIQACEIILPRFLDHPAHTDQVSGQIWLEERVEIGIFCGLDKGIFWGTADWMSATRHSFEVWDFKFGYHPVRPGWQIKAYAVGGGALLDWGGRHRGINDQQGSITIGIAQPTDENNMFKSETHGINILKQWADELKEIVEKALDPKAPRTPGEKQCRYCLAAGTCRERMKMAGEALKGAFEPVGSTQMPASREVKTVDSVDVHASGFDLHPPEPVATVDTLSEVAESKMTQDPEDLAHDEIGRLLDQAPLIKGFLAAVEKEAYKRLQHDMPVLGWKLVKGRKQKQWKTPEEDREALLKRVGLKVSDIYPRKMATLTQLDTLVKSMGKRSRERFEEAWDWEEGNPTLAPETDTRPSVSSVKFEEVKDENTLEKLVEDHLEETEETEEIDPPTYSWLS